MLLLYQFAKGSLYYVVRWECNHTGLFVDIKLTQMYHIIPEVGGHVVGMNKVKIHTLFPNTAVSWWHGFCLLTASMWYPNCSFSSTLSIVRNFWRFLNWCEFFGASVTGVCVGYGYKCWYDMTMVTLCLVYNALHLLAPGWTALEDYGLTEWTHAYVCIHVRTRLYVCMKLNVSIVILCILCGYKISTRDQRYKPLWLVHVHEVYMGKSEECLLSRSTLYVLTRYVLAKQVLMYFFLHCYM
jgi:hypothetical protein